MKTMNMITHVFSVIPRSRSGLSSKLLGLWLLFAVGSAQVAANVVQPAPGETVTSSTVTVSWTPEPGALGYMLGVGTSTEAVKAGKWGDISFQNAGMKTSLDVFNVPLNGATVYLRLWTKTASGWTSQNSSFVTQVGVQDGPARITSPPPSQPLSSGTVLEWSGVGTSEYLIAIGSSHEIISQPPWADIFAWYGTNTSVTLSRIPQDGSEIHIRLYSRIKSRWTYQDFQYNAALVEPATITHPAADTQLQQHAQRVEWAAAEGATKYALSVASAPEILDQPADADIFSRFTEDTSLVVTGIPVDGTPVYMRLWSLIKGDWYYTDSTYSSVFTDAAPDPVAECVERRWETVSLDLQGEQRNLLWRAPAEGAWTKGAIVVLHGGGGASSDWCVEGALTHDMLELTEAAIADGFAVFSLNSIGFKDANGLDCGKRFDALSPPGENKDIAYIEQVLGTTIPGLRPAGSNEKVFMTGISNGGFMTLRASTHFDGSIAAFAPVATGDPYGSLITCPETDVVEDKKRPGGYLDKDSMLAISEVDACAISTGTNDMAWESSNPAQHPPFMVLHHKNDGAVDLSCMNKAKGNLISRGYTHRGTFLVDDDTPRGLETHYWQPEFGPEILEFFESVSAE
ncbi:MAG: hypothetical protein KDI33_17500 [Halioglobus sp.]|nr:hypothetical protein [Halioglobus sp.]